MYTSQNRHVLSLVPALIAAATWFATLWLTGCERRERVLEIDTPGGGVTVDRIEEPDDDERIEVDVHER